MVFRKGAKGKWTKSSMKYFSDFGISYQGGSLSMARISGLKAIKRLVKAGLSSLKPTGAQT